MDNSAFQRKERILKLKRYLNYQISGAVLYFISFFALLFLFIAAGAAIVFSVFMLRVLYQENKTGWIVFFFVLVIIPMILFGLLSIWIPAFRLITLFSIGLFYLYFFFLRFEVNEWVREMNIKIMTEEKLRQHKTEEDVFMKKFE